MNTSVTDIAEVFKALGDPTRLKIIKLILLNGNNLCVGMIAHRLDISQPAVSQHLKVLKNAGIVEANRIGFHIHYNVIEDALKDLGVDIIELLNRLSIELNKGKNCKFEGNKEKRNDAS